MTERRFTIHDEVAFRDRNATRTGRVVGVEHTDDKRRGAGWRYAIVTSDGDVLDVHQDQVDEA